MRAKIAIEMTVNGRRREGSVEARKTLADFLREDLALTGTHLGCEHGVCGACTVLVGGEPVRSCLMLAVQAHGAEVMTVEGLAGQDVRSETAIAPNGSDRSQSLLAKHDALHPVQQAFWESHSFQCGFCTPGFVTTTVALLRENPDPSEEEIREALSGNLCRCTGYESIVAGVRRAAEKLRGGSGAR